MNDRYNELKKAVLEYHDATLLADECAGLTLLGATDEAGKRMETLDDKKEVLEDLVGEIAPEEMLQTAIRKFLSMQHLCASNPKSYMSGGLSLEDRIEILQQFKEMYDAESVMFELAGIEYQREDKA